MEPVPLTPGHLARAAAGSGSGAWPRPLGQPLAVVGRWVGARRGAVPPATASASCPAAAASLGAVGRWQQTAPIFQKCLNISRRLRPPLSGSLPVVPCPHSLSLPCQLDGRVSRPASPSRTHLRCPQPGDSLCSLQEHGRSDQPWEPSRSGAGMPGCGKASNCQ